MSLSVVGLSHRSAPLTLRERFTFSARDLPETLPRLQRDFCVEQVVLLSTCNRVELYVESEDSASTQRDLIDFLSYKSQLSPEAFRSSLYCLTDVQAAEHLFQVTAGLDSMILGESEIYAQVKAAYQAAHAAGTTGPVLNRLFQKALHAAKEVRSKTGVGQGQASIGSVVVMLARRLFADRLSQCEVLLWGAGKAAEATARHLIKSGVKRLWIVNRTPLKAQDLASLCQSGWLSWEQALKHVAHVDIAIVCTQAPHYVIDEADLIAVQPQRGMRPLCLVDLAVPRNIDPALKGYSNLTLYDIDDLQDMAQRGVAVRQGALQQASAVIERQVRYVWERRNIAAQEDSSCQSGELLLSV